MREIRSYFIGLLFRGKDYYLVWQTDINGVDEDRILAIPGRKCPLIADTVEEIELFAKQNGLLIEREEPSIYDIDGLFRGLAMLEPEMPLNVAQCKLALDCWNMFEDMAKSFSIHLPDMESGEGSLLDQV